MDTVTSVLATAVGNGDCEGAKSGAVPVRVPVFTVPVYRPFTVVVSTPFHSARAVRVAEPVAPVPVIPAGCGQTGGAQSDGAADLVGPVPPGDRAERPVAVGGVGAVKVTL